MKRRLFYFAPVLLILFTLIAGFIQPSVAYADTQTQKAAQYCSQLSSGVASGAPNLPNDQQVNLCEKGFLAALDKNATAPPISSQAKTRCASSLATQPDGAECRVFLTKQGVCYSKLYSSDSNEAYYCQVGYIVGYNNRSSFGQLPVDQTPAQQQAAAAATALQNQAAQACNNLNIPGASNDSKLLTACTTGYIASSNGQPEDQACSASAMRKVIYQQWCDNGYSQAQQDAGNTTTPTTNLVCKPGTILGFIPNPLDWMLCGIINGLNLIVTGLDTQITNLLSIGTTSTKSDDPNEIFADSNGGCSETFTPQSGPNKGKALPVCDAYYNAWLPFRNIALGLLVIVGLIIVISQALGMEILDAYTIRKMLPRVLIAAIAITLSWQLMRFAVTLSNDLGYGVRSLIEAPFAQLGINLKLSLGGSLLGLLAGAVGAAFFDLFAMLSFVGTAAIAVLITFLVLILRQIAIILLIIFSPVALIAYVLPNTQRVYKFWWESFSKMLLMFPMIVALISAGHIFAAIASNQGNGLVNQSIAVIAYFAPYFMVPMTFRLSGATMGFLGNAVASRGEGARNALSKFRSGRLQKNTEALKAGTRFEGKKWIPGSVKAATKFGEVSKGVGTGWNGRFGVGPRGKTARRNMDLLAAEKVGEEPGMKAVKGWNDVNRVMAEGMGDERAGHAALMKHLMNGGDMGDTFLSEEDAREKADAAVKAAKVSGGFTKAHGIAAFRAMARDGTAIRDTDDLARLAAIAGQGDKNNTFTLAAEAASVSRQVGRPDLAAASEPIGALAFAHSDLLNKNGHLHSKEAGAAQRDLAQLKHAAWQSGAGGEVAWTKFGSAKGRAVQFDTEHASDVLMNKDGVYTEAQRQEAATMLRETEMAIEQGIGKRNNRVRAAAVMSDPERKAAYDAYMDEEVVTNSGIVNTDPDQPVEVTRGKRRDIISKAAGDRYAGMPAEERERLEAMRREQGNTDGQ